MIFDPYSDRLLVPGLRLALHHLNKTKITITDDDDRLAIFDEVVGAIDLLEDALKQAEIAEYFYNLPKPRFVYISELVSSARARKVVKE